MWGDGTGGDGEREDREDDGGGGRDMSVGVSWWRFWTRSNLNYLRHFASFFYLFFKVFLRCKSLMFNDLRQLGGWRGVALGFTLLSYCVNTCGSPTNPQ